MPDAILKLSTPDWGSDLSDNVYEPREDSFLLLDALESDLHFIKDKLDPIVSLEIGSGSGIIITALSKVLQKRSFCMAVDINRDACEATLETAKLHQTSVEMVQMDLVTCLALKNQIDLLVFNPPYVVTPDEETNHGDITAAWAGGKDGRRILDRLFDSLPGLLSKKSVGYLVVVEENKPDVIENKLCKAGFFAETIARRKVCNEALSIIRFQPKL